VAVSPQTVERIFRAYLKGWLGCTVVPWEEADVDFVTDEELALRRDDGPTIVTVSRRAKLTKTSDNSERISKPFRPGKVSKALLNCIMSGE
jgi:hypothetical protein